MNSQDPTDVFLEIFRKHFKYHKRHILHSRDRPLFNIIQYQESNNPPVKHRTIFYNVKCGVFIIFGTNLKI